MGEEQFGLAFVYKKHRLNHSRVIGTDEMDLISLSCMNSDMMFVKCGDCDCYMEHFVEGYYICPKCGTRVYERTVYRKLDKENSEWLERVDNIDVPEGCAACGGPFPDCMTGCKMYDE